jgi:hypothetical protein
MKSVSLLALALSITSPVLLPGAETKSKRPPAPPKSTAPNPPDTDFSKYPVKGPWVLSDEFLAAAAARRRESNFYEAKIAPYTLPPLLQFADGRPVSSAAEWESRRRPELLALFANTSTASPRAPTASRSRHRPATGKRSAGAATMKRIAIEFPLGTETFPFTSRSSSPTAAPARPGFSAPQSPRPEQHRSHPPRAVRFLARRIRRLPRLRDGRHQRRRRCRSGSQGRHHRRARFLPHAIIPKAAVVHLGHPLRLGLVRLARRRLPRDRLRHRPRAASPSSAIRAPARPPSGPRAQDTRFALACLSTTPARAARRSPAAISARPSAMVATQLSPLVHAEIRHLRQQSGYAPRRYPPAHRPGRAARLPRR